MVPKICSIPDCESTIGRNSARGWCYMHYQRWQRHGDPLGGGPFRPKLSIEDRFWSKVNKTETCWLWVGTMRDTGYGIFSVKNVSHRAHRWSWEMLVGEIPEGMYIDHRCMNKACVKPEHLRLATHKENSEHLAPRSTNTSGYRGVTFNKRKNAWAVRISHNYKGIHGGYFSDVHEAGEAARALRNEIFTHNDLDRIKK